MKLADAIETSKPQEPTQTPELKQPTPKPIEKPTFETPEEPMPLDQKELIKKSIKAALETKNGRNVKDIEALQERHIQRESEKITEKIEELKRKMEELKARPPYCYEELLADPAKVRKKREELDALIEQTEEAIASLEELLATFETR